MVLIRDKKLTNRRLCGRPTHSGRSKRCPGWHDSAVCWPLCDAPRLRRPTSPSSMFSRLDPLVDFRCPHCRTSLRFRRVQELPASTGSPAFLCACPVCGAAVVARQHPAFPDNWRWMRFVAPGIATAAVAIFVPSAGWLAPVGLALLGFGLLALVVYMVRQRWGWQCYGPQPDRPANDRSEAR